MEALGPSLPSRLIALLSKECTDLAVDTCFWESLYLLQEQLSSSLQHQILQHPTAQRVGLPPPHICWHVKGASDAGHRPKMTAPRCSTSLRLPSHATAFTAALPGNHLWSMSCIKYILNCERSLIVTLLYRMRQVDCSYSAVP